MQFEPSSDMIKHWAVFAIYASFAMTFLRVLGNGLGPVVKARMPVTYIIFKSVWSALEATMNDAFKVLHASVSPNQIIAAPSTPPGNAAQSTPSSDAPVTHDAPAQDAPSKDEETKP